MRQTEKQIARFPLGDFAGELSTNIRLLPLVASPKHSPFEGNLPRKYPDPRVLP